MKPAGFLKRIVPLIIRSFICLALIPQSAWPQHTSPPSTIVGHLEDTSGAAVTDARITLRNDAGEVQIQVVTDSEGKFLFSGVSPGRYRLEADHKGFANSK